MNSTPANPKRTRILMQLALVLTLCILLGVLALVFDVFKEPPKEHLVTMRVEASGGYAQITYVDITGKLLETKTISTPWERSAVNPSGTQVYLTAANPTGSGTIQCSIKLDRRDWKADKANFPDDSVACGGIVP